MAGAGGDSVDFVVPALDVPDALVEAAVRWKTALAKRTEGAPTTMPSLAADKRLLYDAFQLLQRKLPRHEVLERAEVLGAGVKAVRLVFKNRLETLGFVVRGLRLASRHLTLPPEFVERTFRHQKRGWSALEAAVVLAFVAQPPPDAPAREPGDTLVYFRVDLPDDAGPCFIAWFSEPRDRAQGAWRLSVALARFTIGAPALLQLSQNVAMARAPNNDHEYNRIIKDFIAETLAKAASKCFGCGASTDHGVKLFKCSRCTGAWYCGAECQRNDWRRHKVTECADLTALLHWHQQTVQP
jgi:hypothetical protein